MREGGGFVRQGPTTWTATAILDGTTAVVPVAQVDGEAVTGPPAVVPYGPEGEPRGDRPEGVRILTEVARVGGGHLREDLAGLYAGLPPVAGGERDLSPALVLLAFLVLLAEIAIRRFGLGWPRGWRFRRAVAVPAPVPAAAPAVSPVAEPAAPAPAPPAAADPDTSALAQALRRRQR